MTLSRLALWALVAAGLPFAALAQEENPTVVVPPPSGGVYKAAVQRFYDGGGAGESATSLRSGIGEALEFSDLFSVLDANAFLASDVSARLDGSAPVVCADWGQIGADTLVEGEIARRGERVAVEFRAWDVARCQKVGRKRYEGPSSDLPRIAKRIADDVVGAFTGTRGVAATEIAFASNRSGNVEIFAMDADGSDVRQATHNKSINNFPAWSPDGNTIVYTSYREGKRPALFVLTRGTQSPGRIFRSLVPGSQHFRGVFDPTGSKLAVVVSADGNSEIYLVSRDGKTSRRLTTDRSLEVSPTFSPDGRQLAFVSDRAGAPQVYLMDVDGGNVRRLTYQGGYNTSPAWSPDGRWIAYESRVGGQFDIWLIDPEGTTNVPLVENPRNDVSAAWSPDSRKVAFSSDRRGRSDIYAIGVGGGKERQLTRDGRSNSAPAWGPFPRELR
jgi:TolB protein